MIDQVFAVLGHQFRNEELLTEALTHASSAGHRLESNERMEFLGDAILGYIVCEYLYHSYPEFLEGELTKIKSAVVSRKVCAQISQKLDLCSLLNLGKGMRRRDALPASVAAAVPEAIIAAIYLDSDIHTAKNFILQHIEPFIEQAANSTHQSNFKSVLQQHVQRLHGVSPSYHILDEKGPDHDKSFKIGVEVHGENYEPSWGQSKKQAEQQAAMNALQAMGVVEICDEGNAHMAE